MNLWLEKEVTQASYKVNKLKLGDGSPWVSGVSARFASKARKAWVLDYLYACLCPVTSPERQGLLQNKGQRIAHYNRCRSLPSGVLSRSREGPGHAPGTFCVTPMGPGGKGRTNAKDAAVSAACGAVAQWEIPLPLAQKPCG